LLEGRPKEAMTRAKGLFKGNAEGDADAKLLVISCMALQSSLSGGVASSASEAAEEYSREFAKSGDKRGEACMKVAAAELGGLMAKDGTDFEAALEKVQEALSVFQDVKDKRMEACTLLASANLYSNRQRVAEANQAANSALMLFMDSSDVVGQAKAHWP